jgi:hypothetical protein
MPSKKKREPRRVDARTEEARAFSELFERAINAGEGYWRDHIASLYMLVQALRWHRAALSEWRRFDELGERENYPHKMIVKHTFNDVFKAFEKEPPAWLPPELIAGYTPTLQRIIAARAAFDERERQEAQESERRRLAGLKGWQTRKAKARNGGQV